MGAPTQHPTAAACRSEPPGMGSQGCTLSPCPDGVQGPGLRQNSGGAARQQRGPLLTPHSATSATTRARSSDVGTSCPPNPPGSSGTTHLSPCPPRHHTAPTPHPTPTPPLGSRSSVGSKAAGTALSAVGHRRVGRAFHPHSLLLLWLSAAWSQPPPPSVGAISLGAGGGGTAPCAKPYGRGQGRTEATREGWGKKHIYI